MHVGQTFGEPERGRPAEVSPAAWSEPTELHSPRPRCPCRPSGSRRLCARVPATRSVRCAGQAHAGRTGILVRMRKPPGDRGGHVTRGHGPGGSRTRTRARASNSLTNSHPYTGHMHSPQDRGRKYVLPNSSPATWFE